LGVLILMINYFLIAICIYLTISIILNKITYNNYVEMKKDYEIIKKDSECVLQDINKSLASKQIQYETLKFLNESITIAKEHGLLDIQELVNVTLKFSNDLGEDK
jgi:hypothetical protein